MIYTNEYHPIHVPNVVICFQINKNDLWYTLDNAMFKQGKQLWFAFRLIKTIFDIHFRYMFTCICAVVICFQINKNDLWYTLQVVVILMKLQLWFAFRLIKTIFDIHFIIRMVLAWMCCDLLSDFKNDLWYTLVYFWYSICHWLWFAFRF